LLNITCLQLLASYVSPYLVTIRLTAVNCRYFRCLCILGYPDDTSKYVVGGNVTIFFLSRPTNRPYIYTYIYNIVSTATCFDTSPHNLQGVLSLYCAKVTKLLKLHLNKISGLKCSRDRC
jgi:hypothetical protein